MSVQHKVVCHLTDAHKRYDMRIFCKECKSLARAGYQVYLVVCDDKPDEVLEGVHIVSTGFKPDNRKERFLKGSRMVLEKALELKADVYHLHDPELLTVLGKLKKTGAKVIFDAHEDTEAQILDKTYIPLPFLKTVSKLYRLYAKRKMQSADALISVSPELVEKFRKYNEEIAMITNYPVLSEASGGGRTEENDTPYIFFAGGVAQQWMHDVIINAIADIDDIRYILAGPGSKDYLNQLRSLEGWNKAEYLGIIPHEQVCRWYKHALAGMAINYCSQLVGKGTLGNTKLFEIMECGKPVICTDYSLWKDIVEANECGICLNPNDAKAIRKAILYLKDHPCEGMRMGKNGRKAVEEKYNWLIEEEKLLCFYGELLS